MSAGCITLRSVKREERLGTSTPQIPASRKPTSVNVEEFLTAGFRSGKCRSVRQERHGGSFAKFTIFQVARTTSVDLVFVATHKERRQYTVIIAASPSRKPVVAWKRRRKGQLALRGTVPVETFGSAVRSSRQRNHGGRTILSIRKSKPGDKNQRCPLGTAGSALCCSRFCLRDILPWCKTDHGKRISCIRIPGSEG